MPLRIIHLDSIDSTSTHARRLIESDPAVPARFVVVARTQDAGRGQFARTWSSPEGGLWCTYVWPRDDISLDGLGLRIGLACARTIENTLRRTGHADEVRLKWPNDVYLTGRKVLGVLTEGLSAHARHFLLIGVGINANFAADELPVAVAARATTLRDVTGATFDLGVLLSDLTANLEAVLHLPGIDRVTLAEARFRLHGVGHEAEVRVGDGSTVRGVLTGLNDAGCPVVRTQSGDVTGVAMDPL